MCSDRKRIMFESTSFLPSKSYRICFRLWSSRRREVRRRLGRRNMWSCSPRRPRRWAPPPQTLATTCSAFWRAAKLQPTSSCPPSVCLRCWHSCPWVKTQTHYKLKPNWCFGFGPHGVYGLGGQTNRKLFHAFVPHLHLFPLHSAKMNQLETVGLQDCPDRDNRDATLSFFIIHINYSAAQLENFRLGLIADFSRWTWSRKWLFGFHIILSNAFCG